eukprot:gene10656-11605_t
MVHHSCCGGHHHGGGGGGGHHHHNHHDCCCCHHGVIDRQMQYLPFITYGLLSIPQRRVVNDPPPSTPLNSVLAINTLEGELKSQHYVPNEASDCLALNELNFFVQKMNQTLTQTSPNRFIMQALTLFLTIGGAFLYIAVGEPFYGFEIFIDIVLGSCAGFVLSAFLVTLYAKSMINRRKKIVHDVLDHENHQTYLSRECHWEEHVPRTNHQSFYLFLVKHDNDTRSPLIADTHSIPIAVVTFDSEHRSDIEMASAPLLQNK